MKVNLKNETGVIRNVKVGFSWTLFFFGGIPFIFRGMLLHFLTCIVISLFTWGLANVIIAFIGNKITAIYYLEHGYKRTGSGWDYANNKWGLSPDNIT